MHVVSSQQMFGCRDIEHFVRCKMALEGKDPDSEMKKLTGNFSAFLKECNNSGFVCLQQMRESEVLMSHLGLTKATFPGKTVATLKRIHEFENKKKRKTDDQYISCFQANYNHDKIKKKLEKKYDDSNPKIKADEDKRTDEQKNADEETKKSLIEKFMKEVETKAMKCIYTDASKTELNEITISKYLKEVVEKGKLSRLFSAKQKAKVVEMWNMMINDKEESFYFDTTTAVGGKHLKIVFYLDQIFDPEDANDHVGHFEIRHISILLTGEGLKFGQYGGVSKEEWSNGYVGTFATSPKKVGKSPGPPSGPQMMNFGSTSSLRLPPGYF